jgi:hypothetical protein
MIESYQVNLFHENFSISLTFIFRRLGLRVEKTILELEMTRKIELTVLVCVAPLEPASAC